MATRHTDLPTSGNWQYIYGTDPSGDIFDLTYGRDWLTGVGNDVVNILGGINASPYPNHYSFSGTTNSINLNGSNTQLWIGDFFPSTNIQYINGTSFGNVIYAGVYQTPTSVMDFSAMTMTGIAKIYGSQHDITFRGSGNFLTGTSTGIPVYLGSGHDTIYESGNDTASETKGTDNIDGQGGYDIYYASGDSRTYTPLFSGSFNNGSTWSFLDAAGYSITLYNIEKVVFTDKAFYSGTALTPMVDADGTANAVSITAVNGTGVGITTSTTTPNQGATLTYSLVNGAGSPFVVNASTGVVTVGNSTTLDGSATSYSVTVQATDGTLSRSRSRPTCPP